MTRPPPRVLAVLLVVIAAALALTLVNLVRGGSDVAPPSSPAGRAVTALTTSTGTQALRAVPDDFEATLGYQPVLQDGELVRPDGDCSSPVPLPRTFEPACRQHDLGYDLLRHAALTGRPLGGWARTSIDELLRVRLQRTCAATGNPACDVSAQVASSVVALNSWRQLGGVPQETPAVQASLAASTAGVLGVGTLTLPGRRRRAVAAALRARLPGALTSALVAVAVLVSLAPSLLPRPAVVQGPLTGVLVAVALGVGGVVRLVWRRLPPRRLPPRRSVSVGRGHALLVGGGLVVVGVGSNHRYQEGLAMRLDMAGPDATYWPAVATLAVVVAILLTGLARGAGVTVRASVSRLGALRPRVRQLVTAGCGVIMVVLGLAAGPGAVQGPVLGLLDKDLDAHHAMLQRSSVGSGRVFVRVSDVGEAAAPEQAARLAASRLVEAGVRGRRAVVVVVPTGSGWVNRNAIEGFERQLGAGVATVAVQYDRSPSWLSLLAERDVSAASARAVVDAVAARIDELPAGERPALHVYGESLGALAGQAALADHARASHVCGSLWSGVPGGGTLGIARERALANADDPIVHLVPGTATHRPLRWAGALWLPWVSYGGAAVDTLSSLAPGDGHGHRYGPEQDWTLPTCSSPVAAGARHTG